MNAKDKEYAAQVLDQLTFCSRNLGEGFQIARHQLEQGEPIEDYLLEGLEALAAVVANVQTLRNQMLTEFQREEPEEELAVVLQFPTLIPGSN